MKNNSDKPWAEFQTVDSDEEPTGALWDRVPHHYHDEERRGPTRKPKRKAEAAFNAHTPYGDGHLPILAIMHGADVHHAKRFQREDPEDRKAFCQFVRGYLVYNFSLTLRKSKFEEIIMTSPIPDNPPKRFDSGNPDHRAISTSLHFTNRGWTYWKHAKRHGERGRQFMKDHDLAVDEQARFRISLALLGSEYESLSLRDLRVLMAVNSCLEDGFGTINLEVLSWRAVGAWSKERLHLLGVRPLGEQQVRSALDKLQKEGLIRRLVIGRTTYAAKGSIPESVFHKLAAERALDGKARRGILRNGKLEVITQVVD